MTTDVMPVLLANTSGALQTGDEASSVTVYVTEADPLLSVTDDGMATAPAHLANVAVVMQSVIDAVSGVPMVSNTHVIPEVVEESERSVAAVA
jgi:hypothetical protein